MSLKCEPWHLGRDKTDLKAIALSLCHSLFLSFSFLSFCLPPLLFSLPFISLIAFLSICLSPLSLVSFLPLSLFLFYFPPIPREARNRKCKCEDGFLHRLD